MSRPEQLKSVLRPNHCTIIQRNAKWEKCSHFILLLCAQQVEEGSCSLLEKGLESIQIPFPNYTNRFSTLFSWSCIYLVLFSIIKVIPSCLFSKTIFQYFQLFCVHWMSCIEWLSYLSRYTECWYDLRHIDWKLK